MTEKKRQTLNEVIKFVVTVLTALLGGTGCIILHPIVRRTAYEKD